MHLSKIRNVALWNKTYYYYYLWSYVGQQLKLPNPKNRLTAICLRLHRLYAAHADTASPMERPSEKVRNALELTTPTQSITNFAHAWIFNIINFSYIPVSTTHGVWSIDHHCKCTQAYSVILRKTRRLSRLYL